MKRNTFPLPDFAHSKEVRTRDDDFKQMQPISTLSNGTAVDGSCLSFSPYYIDLAAMYLPEIQLSEYVS